MLIVPAWIMKYYILDLSPHNLMLKFLTDQGFTVFLIFWRNPGPGDRNISFDDYRKLGAEAAAATIRQIVPDRQIHALGYCLGGRCCRSSLRRWDEVATPDSSRSVC